MANINGVDPPPLNDQDYVDKITTSLNAIDNHDHTAGKGVPLATAALADGAVTDVKIAGPVTRSKLAAGSNNHVVINDGSGVLSSEATLARSRGGSGQDNSSITFPASGVLVTEAGTQTLTNKTLTTPTMSSPVISAGQLQLPEIATPATPSSGNGRIYFKSDGFLYQLNDDGAESKVGAGSGGINYITNPDAESNTVGWTTYADAAATAPVDGTGGTANVTWTRSTTTPLRGVGEFLFTKDAVNRQGQGVSSAFTISIADQAKVMQISFDARLASGTYANATPDMTVWIYDVTNAVLIQPSVFRLDGIISTVAQTFQAQFQTAANSTSYRLILHCGSTSAAAYTIEFDNFIVGPSQLGAAAVITDPQPYTPSLTNCGNATAVGSWQRVGAMIDVQATITIGTTLPNGSGISIGIPPGLQMDISALRGTQDDTLGIASTNVGANTHTGIVRYFTSNTVYPAGDDGSGQWVNVVPITWAAGNKFTVRFQAPIQGWSASSTVLGAEAARTVAFTGRFQAAQSIADSLQVLLNLATIQGDTHAGQVGNTYRVPVSGFYRIEAGVEYDANGTGSRVIYIQTSPDGTTWTDAGDQATKAIGGGVDPVCVSKVLNLTAGSFLRFVTFQNSGGAWPISATATRNNFAITRISGPEAIGAGEAINAKYEVCTTAATTGAALVYTTRVYDTHAAYNTSTGVYTIPTAGVYSLQAVFRGGTHAAAVTDEVVIEARRNGTLFSVVGAMQWNAAATLRAEVFGCTRINCVAGDTITFNLVNTFGATITGNGVAARNYICIEKVG